MTKVTEDSAEQLCLEWLEALGYTRLHGPDISPGGANQERGSYFDVVLRDRLDHALGSINPHIMPPILEEAGRRVFYLSSASLVWNRRSGEAIARLAPLPRASGHRDVDGALGQLLAEAALIEFRN